MAIGWFIIIIIINIIIIITATTTTTTIIIIGLTQLIPQLRPLWMILCSSPYSLNISL